MIIKRSLLFFIDRVGTKAKGYLRNKPDGGKSTTDWSISGNSIASSTIGDISVGVIFLF